MRLTKEQEKIIRSTGDIKINAVAGSGKTTTVIEYAKTRPVKSRILYLAFNRSVRLEATHKFENLGLRNVRIETAHSLAYKYVVSRGQYRVRPQGYRIHEIADLLKLRMKGEKLLDFIVANHVSKFVTYFCNSDKQRVQDLNYLDTIADAKARTFVKTHYKIIEKLTRRFLALMDQGKIEITHDFYLKKFQLAKPVLPFDYILFDEGQDASSAMLDVFSRQKATKVIVGDTHQQIYGWRYAINSLEKTDFADYYLTASFRFPQDIADLAVGVLGWKRKLGYNKEILLTGKGKSKKVKSRAVLGRTNLALLLEAIRRAERGKAGEKIYFEGNFSSYAFAEEGASLYDVLNLYKGARDRIRDRLIREMNSMRELEEYIEKTGDAELGMMQKIVEEHGDEIPKLIRQLKDRQIEGDDRDRADIIYSTVHRSKGMEYDAVQILGDFITEEKLDALLKKEGDEEADRGKLNEEINLLYVAVTRAKCEIEIPFELLPAGLSPSKNIRIGLEPKVEKKPALRRSTSGRSDRYNGKSKTNSAAKIRKKHTAAYQPWTAEMDEELTRMYGAGVEAEEMAEYLGRTKGAIWARVKKLGLWDW